jgi:hypothetical protein
LIDAPPRVSKSRQQQRDGLGRKLPAGRDGMALFGAGFGGEHDLLVKLVGASASGKRRGR